jgi:hypothetical protein
LSGPEAIVAVVFFASVGGVGMTLDEIQNRLDFAERLLGQARERGQLSPPADR